MTEELLAYLLDDLCPERRAAVEHNIAIDPAWRRELERLQACLAAGGDRADCGCSDQEAPPEDLLTRTCFLVERACRSPDGQGQVALDPARSAPADRRAPAVRGMSPERCPGALARSWTIRDLTVACSVLLGLGALMTPALYETRATSRRLTCESNLQTIGTALFNYQTNHARQLPPVLPGQSAAVFAVELRDGAGLTEEQLEQLLVCPDSPLAARLAAGGVRFAWPTREEVRAASDDRLAELLQRIPSSYAYRVGYYDVEDQYQQLPYTGDPQLPLVSDAPELTRQGLRSANHVGGQYVLYECLTPKYRANAAPAGQLGGYYLNKAGRHAAGVDENDVVLIRADRSPMGELMPVAAPR